MFTALAYILAFPLLMVLLYPVLDPKKRKGVYVIATLIFVTLFFGSLLIANWHRIFPK